jgi:CheY-specific phosphatase CheX
MVAGGAKALLQSQGIEFVISLPTVAVGHEHRLESPKGCSTVVIPLRLPDGDIYMELSVG